MGNHPKFKFVRSFVPLLCLMAAGAALACGPDFPTQLFDNRNRTLKATPKNSFTYEAMHLVAAPGRFTPVEPDPYDYDSPRSRAGLSLLQWSERMGLSHAQAVAIEAMRGETDGGRALGRSAGLPTAIKLYTAGAVDFHAKNYAAARSRFAAVLALPPDQARPRALWAIYSLARIDALSGDTAGAQKGFTMVRRMAAQGMPDNFGLAVASLGEEARLHLRRANALLTPRPLPTPAADWRKVSPLYTLVVPAQDARPNDADMVLANARLPANKAAAYAGEMKEAAWLYAQQAACKSSYGVESLSILAQNILAEPARIDATIADPVIQQALVAYVLTSVEDQTSAAHDPDYPYDAGIASKTVHPAPVLVRLIDAFQHRKIDRPAAADRLAALAYRTGRYALAEQMAGKSPSPLAEWVKAKLSVQKGDLTDAQKHYAAASHGFPASDMPADSSRRLAGEHGTLAMARGRYVEALTILYPVATDYWGDVAHIADRVLTVDELKAFVDATIPKPNAGACPERNYFSIGYGPTHFAHGMVLREMLARRLMREGRFDVALPYFCADKLRAQAGAYADGLRVAESGAGNAARARALFQAATIARHRGMEIMGTEGAPDYTVIDGLFECCVGQEKLDGAFVTADEKRRFAISAARPDRRYHYRTIAADEAEQAATLLPPHSQAFAAVLCSASSWVIDAPDSDRGQAIYRRYVKEGARMPWATHFGRSCPKPVFGRLESKPG